jgi:hypothetical protein
MGVIISVSTGLSAALKLTAFRLAGGIFMESSVGCASSSSSIASEVGGSLLALC